MAKQTFTTGQVLTAAQMTNLQQTAMLGGDANARTASYVLVAGDAGNAVTMSSTSTTTITVNTGIFAAGDIVTIVNINSGVCTITAGTATVTTSGSLALSQNQGGILRFTSASAAIFLQFATPASGDIEGITTGANSGLTGGVTSGTADLKLNFTAKGQLPVGTGSGTTGFLTVGTNGHTLVADSAETTGLKWAAAGSSKTWTLLNAGGTTLTGAATVTVSGISNVEDLMIFVVQASSASASSEIGFRFNGDTNANYGHTGFEIEAGSTYSANNFSIRQNLANNFFFLAKMSSNAASQISGGVWVSGCKSTGLKAIMGNGGGSPGGGNTQTANSSIGFYSASAAITSVSAFSLTGNFDNGTLYVYGA